MFYHNISPILIEIGPLTIRWYGLIFAIGLLLAYFFMQWIYKREKFDLNHLDSVTLFLFIGMFIGARLGHVFFYEASYYLSDPIEILKVWKGGLSSHGAALGVLVAYLIWLKVYKVKFSKYVDYLVIGFPIVSTCVRIANFFNSEIIGRPTSGSWGVVFQRLGEDFPRYPSQLYEAGLSLLIFIVLFLVYKNYQNKLPTYFNLFFYIFLYFSTRFIVEFWKERHAIPDSFPLSMGQILSILPVLIAIGYFIYLFKRSLKKT
jgi:prolipoprotein diacylglyceryl transferase